VDAAAATPDITVALAIAAAYEAGISQLQVDSKRAAVRFGALACSCPAWFDWAQREPPQAGCPLHGNIIVTAEGLVL
jgi:hypothetical protein